MLYFVLILLALAVGGVFMDAGVPFMAAVGLLVALMLLALMLLDLMRPKR